MILIKYAAKLEVSYLDKVKALEIAIYIEEQYHQGKDYKELIQQAKEGFYE